MNTSNNNYPINFGAKFIRPVKIKVHDQTSNKYKTVKAAFLEFDPKNRNDAESLSNALGKWDGQDFARQIVENAKLLSRGKMNKGNNKIYMLAKQQESYHEVEPDNILGMAHMKLKRRKSDELLLFQTRPDTKHGTKNRKYKNIGSEIINSLKQIYSKSIELISSYKSANFYEKHDFVLIEPMALRYRWKTN